MRYIVHGTPKGFYVWDTLLKCKANAYGLALYSNVNFARAHANTLNGLPPDGYRFTGLCRSVA